jgi:hypothetical protein
VKKILAGALGGVAVAMAIFGAGPANAVDEYKGLTYEQVQQQARRQTIVIASRVGEYLPTEKCIVSSNRTASVSDSSGNLSSKLYVYLNCNDPMTAGHPGYSAVSPKGKEAADYRDKAQRLSANYENAIEAGESPFCEAEAERCARICEQAGTCSEALVDYLGL